MSEIAKDGLVHLTSGRLLARNAAWNLAGQTLPLLAGIVLIPYIIRRLGADRFGMLGIIWVVFGYFSLMDLGLGRATTKFLAEWLAKREWRRISEMVWSSLALQILFGIVGGGIIAAFTPMLVERVLRTPTSLTGEGRIAFYILAAALPFVLASNGLRAVLEGCQRFDIANVLRIPSSTLAFVIPAIAIASGLRLPGVVLWMAISRVGFALAHAYYCLRVLPSLRTVPAFRSEVVLPLLSFGGWVTASNVINPILLSLDRFLIGSFISVAMVGYYTAPFEAVTKLLIIPASLMTTVYPACSALGTERINDLQKLYSRTVKYIFCAIAPVSLVLILFARPIIGAWLGQPLAEKSSVVLQLLAVGVFINCFAHVPYSFLQALGRPDAAAKLFLCELLPYGLLAWWMIHKYGIAGAAAASAIRVLIEVLLLMAISHRVLSLSPWHVVDRSMWTAAGALCAAGLAIYAADFFLRGILFLDAVVCAAWLAGFGLTVWKWVLDSADRASALSLLSSFRNVFGKFLESAEAD